MQLQSRGDSENVARNTVSTEVCLYALGGFRPSEIYSLQWTEVNWDTREITVLASVDRRHVDAPKTERLGRDNVCATRVQVLPQRAIDAIREHRKWLLATEHVGLGTNLVFPSDAGTHRTPARMSKVFDQVAALMQTDIRIRPQVLRRTYNTVMKDLTDMATLHAMIGHSDAKMTELCSGIDYDRKAKAVAAFEAALAAGKVAG